jgi:aminoglycoside phosphotransferase
MSALCMENLRQSFMSCPKDKFSMHKTFIYLLSSVQVLHAQDTQLCPVLGASSPCTRHSVMSCPKGKFSMHKAHIYVLSSGQVLHAQDIRLCPV